MFEVQPTRFQPRHLLRNALFQPRVAISTAHKLLPRFGSASFVFGGLGSTSVFWDALTSDGTRPAYCFFPRLALAYKAQTEATPPLGVFGTAMSALQPHDSLYTAEVAVTLSMLGDTSGALFANAPSVATGALRRSALLQLLPMLHFRQLCGLSRWLDIDPQFY